MTTVLTAPAVSANEDEILLAVWHVPDGSEVTQGQIVCAIETTKAAVDVEATASGTLRHAVEAGSKVKIGDPIAEIGEAAASSVREDKPADAPPAQAQSVTAPAEPDTPPVVPADPAGADEPLERRWTLKAEIVANRLNVDISALAAERPDRTIVEADVIAAGAGAMTAEDAQGLYDEAGDVPVRRDLMEERHPKGGPERILLLGGGAGAGQLTVDILSRIPDQRAAGILDSNIDVHGCTVGGVPVMGGLDRAEELWRAGFCDSVIILFTQDNAERHEAFDRLKSAGVPFANILGPGTQVLGHVAMGEGNLIMGNCYIATGVTLGDNNFLASQSCIEHHSTVGSHCTFGPRTTTSGAVTVGNGVKTGMGVCVEPYRTIGDDALIASGSVITTDIPARSIVKAHGQPLVRPRDAA